MPKHHIAGAAALLLATAPAAWAEIDAQTIWSDWQDVSSRFGGTLTAASEDYAGGTLTLTDVSMASDLAGTESTTTYGTVTMTEQGDGTVRIELPETISYTSTTTVDGATVEQVFDTTFDGSDVVVREEDGVRTYDITMDALTAVMSSTAEEPAEDEAAPGEFSFTMSNIVSTYRSGLGGDANAFDQSTTADGIDVAASIMGEVTDETEGGTDDQADDDTGGGTDDGIGGAAPRVDLTYALTGITSQVEGSYGEAPTGPVTSLSDLGLTYDGDVSHSGGTLDITGEGPQGPFSVTSTSASGTLTFESSEDTLGYLVGSTDVAAMIEAPGLPVPIELTMAESSTGLTLPLGESDESGVAKPFAVALSLRELAFDDALWSLFDPTGQLPRDPATLVVDMDGTAELNVDLFGGPQAMAGLQGPPGDLETLNLNQILVSAAGAELRGSGALEFPEVTPVPEPVGTIELALDGGFALVDKLVALGFIPQEQATFVKGLTGAVARTVGDDQLESTIEFTPGGGISANGLPLK